MVTLNEIDETLATHICSYYLVAMDELMDDDGVSSENAVHKIAEHVASSDSLENIQKFLENGREWLRKENFPWAEIAEETWGFETEQETREWFAEYLDIMEEVLKERRASLV